jgi:murein DD-endopeptidase MepM/ murein hydrolase activator NlpD
MSTVGPDSPHSFARRKSPFRVIIAHGENVRSFTVRPWLTAAVCGIAVVFSALYLAATGYLVFRDDLLAASIARQSRMQNAYEDRIAGLRSDIDRLTSRQLLNQEAVEAEVERLVGRQAALDARQDIIANLSQAVRRAGLGAEPAAAGNSASADPGTASEPVDPLKTSSIAPVEAGALPFFSGLRMGADAQTPMPAPVIELGSVETSLDKLAQQQVAFVDAVASDVGHRADRIGSVLRRLGHRVPASHVSPGSDIGGPFVAIENNADPETFRAGVDLVTGEIERFSAIRRMAGQLPLSKPIPNAPITSRYGPRLDPFLGQPAMHTGIDFRAAAGYPARATAGGTVITAEYTGGYGNMVEIDHGNGVTTRYGHLSRIDVTVGQVVAKGAIVGRAGSTGRSTGPHLHYEVRIDGSAIDPMRYIKAGSEITPLL